MRGLPLAEKKRLKSWLAGRIVAVLPPSRPVDAWCADLALAWASSARLCACARRGAAIAPCIAPVTVPEMCERDGRTMAVVYRSGEGALNL